MRKLSTWTVVASALAVTACAHQPVPTTPAPSGTSKAAVPSAQTASPAYYFLGVRVEPVGASSW